MRSLNSVQLKSSVESKKQKTLTAQTGAARACSGTASGLLHWLLEKAQRGLWRGIRLRQHRCACLHENVVLGEIGALFRDIHISDAAAGGAQIVLQHGQ